MVKHKTEHLLLLSRVFDIPKGVTNYVEYHEKPEDLTIFKKKIYGSFVASCCGEDFEHF
jgi:hypothetical protein